jgi:hypothetical protein
MCLARSMFQANEIRNPNIETRNKLGTNKSLIQNLKTTAGSTFGILVIRSLRLSRISDFELRILTFTVLRALRGESFWRQFSTIVVREMNLTFLWREFRNVFEPEHKARENF